MLTPLQRATVERIRPRRRPALDLAVALVASGDATTRKAAQVYGLDPRDVLAAFNARHPRARRGWT